MFPKCVGVLTMYVYYQRFLRVILTWVTVFFPTLLIVYREAIPSVPFFVWIKRIRILPLHSRLLSLAASLWVILDGSASLFPFKHTRPWIFSSALRQEPVRTSLWGHPGGHWGANQASGQGSLVIIMQGIFSLPSTEERQRDTGHRLLTHSWQLFALSDFKPAALKKKKKLVYKWMPHDSRSRGKWVWKGKFSYFNSYSKSVPQMEMPPIFFTPLCWWRFCWHFRIKLSPCRHFTKGKNSAEAQGGNVFEHQQSVTCLYGAFVVSSKKSSNFSPVVKFVFSQF